MPAFISDDSASGDSAEEEPFDATLLEKFVSATDPVTLPVPTATTVDEVLNVIVALAAPSEPARVRIMFKKIGQGFHDWMSRGEQTRTNSVVSKPGMFLSQGSSPCPALEEA